MVESVGPQANCFSGNSASKRAAVRGWQLILSACFSGRLSSPHQSCYCGGTVVVRFVILEPACQCHVVTSLAADLAGGATSPARLVFGVITGSGSAGTGLTAPAAPAGFASALSKYGDASLSDLASGGRFSIMRSGERAGSATVSPRIGCAPMLLLKAKSPPNGIRQISASQAVLRILDPHVQAARRTLKKT